MSSLSTAETVALKEEARIMTTAGQINYDRWAQGPPALFNTWENKLPEEKAAWEAAAQAVLASQWRSVSEPPEDGPLVLTHCGHCFGFARSRGVISKDATHWMVIPPLPAPPVPTSEEKERAEFDRWWNDDHELLAQGKAICDAGKQPEWRRRPSHE